MDALSSRRNVCIWRVVILTCTSSQCHFSVSYPLIASIHRSRKSPQTVSRERVAAAESHATYIMSSVALSTHQEKEDKIPASTLQVNRDAEGLQVDYNGLYPDPMKKHHPDDKYISQHNDAGLMLMEQATPEPVTVKHKRERICGLKRRIFFIVLTVILLVVIVAAVGGGVGGYQASKKSTPTPTRYVQQS